MKEVTAKVKWVRSAPRKIMRIVDLVRGKPATEALAFLKFMPHKAARILEKVIKSAVANAKNNHKLNEAGLMIRQAYVNKGIVMKRFQPRAKGRAFPIKKKTSHVTISLVSSEEK